jgi:hypothetical protein
MPAIINHSPQNIVVSLVNKHPFDYTPSEDVDLPISLLPISNAEMGKLTAAEKIQVAALKMQYNQQLNAQKATQLVDYQSKMIAKGVDFIVLLQGVLENISDELFNILKEIPEIQAYAEQRMITLVSSSNTDTQVEFGIEVSKKHNRDELGSYPVYDAKGLVCKDGALVSGAINIDKTVNKPVLLESAKNIGETSDAIGGLEFGTSRKK